MAIGSSRFFGFALWITWKKLQVFLRAHLSHVLGFSLAMWVLIGKIPELEKLFQSYHLQRQEAVGLVLVLGTLSAVLWELFGNRRSRSLQEARFVTAMHALLHELEKFMYGADRESDPSRKLEEFT